jgi:hypothetical protein
MEDLGFLCLRLAVAAVIVVVTTRLSSFCSKALICLLDSFKLRHIPGDKQNSSLPCFPLVVQLTTPPALFVKDDFCVAHGEGELYIVADILCT